MSVRKIVQYPQQKSVLRKKSEPVQAFNRYVRGVIRDLKDTLLAHPEGVGLAAPQINVHQRVVIVRLGGRTNPDGIPDLPIALVNPEIVAARDERLDFDGCLSFPGLYGDTIRPHYLRVTGLDEQGEPFDQVFEDFDAVVIHHEIDHLDGVLFIDRLERIEDLYRVHLDEEGNYVRVPASLGVEIGR